MIYLHAFGIFGIWIMPESENCNLKWVRIINIVVVKLVHANRSIQRLWIHVCISHLITQRGFLNRLFSRRIKEKKTQFCLSVFGRKCTINWIPFHFVNTIFTRSRNVIIIQFPPFCNRIRGCGIWSVNRVRFVHNLYDTQTFRISVDYRQYLNETNPRFELVLLFCEYSFFFFLIYRARSFTQPSCKCTHTHTLLFKHYFVIKKTNWINN